MKPDTSIGFASDNNSGVHPEILDAMYLVNTGPTLAYGHDDFTESAVNAFKREFGEDIDVYFVFTGTAANVLSIRALTKSYHAVICSQTAHLHNDECAAPEQQTGCKLLPISTNNGKIGIDGIRKMRGTPGFEHHVQPKVISITQATEWGTVYLQEEIAAIASFAHRHDMYLHMDGARLANAAQFLNTTLRDLTKDAGVDVLSFGGTKNGMMIGEAVVFMDKKLSPDFKYIRKQRMQLGSKMRFISAQFQAFFENGLWRKIASHSNGMACYLAEKIENIPELEIVQPVESNHVFARIPSALLQTLKKQYKFHVWNEEQSIVRWMTTFDTTEEDIDRFVETIRQNL